MGVIGDDDLTTPPWQTIDRLLVYAHPDLYLLACQVLDGEGAPLPCGT